MKFLSAVKSNLPRPLNILLAVFSAILLILAFPDFEFWFFAWFALIPLFYAIEREKESLIKSFLVGWIFGTIFFFSSCWWLTHAPITYAGFPPVLAYFLLFSASSIVALFPALFSLLLSLLLNRFGSYAILSAPFLWTTIEFLRFWTTGNNWNAIGYSQAFQPILITAASFGGIYLTGFLLLLFNTAFTFQIIHKINGIKFWRFTNWISFAFLMTGSFLPFVLPKNNLLQILDSAQSRIIAIQPNVPMTGLTEEKWLNLRRKHVELAENALQKFEGQRTKDKGQTTIIFPESPMNFMYERDEEFQKFVRGFASRNDVNVLFNAAEPDAENNKFFNSAVLVNTEGRKIAQYDKIYLVPFGESVPAPLQNIVPALVGSFSFGKEYDLLPFGEASGGVMICFESHFPNLAREYVRRGADVLVEMTNDGYLGKTPVLRQHLANAVFRAVETNRPVLRVTNVGITAYINERGAILEPSESYTEDTRVWTVAKSNSGQTFYVKYGDWFAWLCVIVSLGLLFAAFLKRNRLANNT